MTRTSGWTDVLPGRRRAEELAAALDSGRLPVDPGLADLVVLARALAPAPLAPSPAFRDHLRAQLVEQAATRPVAVPAPRGPAPQRHLRPRVRRTAAVLATVSVVAGTGATAASSRALPGEALYGLKRGVEGAQLALARDDLGRGRELLEQAATRIGEAQRLAGGGASSAQVAAALDAYDAALDAGALALADSYRETGADEPLLLLAEFVVVQQPQLEELLGEVVPGLRARVQAALDLLAVLQVRTEAVLGPDEATGVASAGLVGAQLATHPSALRTPTTPSPYDATRLERPPPDAHRPAQEALPRAGTGGPGTVDGTATSSPAAGVEVDAGTGQVAADVATGSTVSVSTPPAPTPASPAPLPEPSVEVPAVEVPPVEVPPVEVPPVEVPPADVQAPCLPTDPTC